MYYNLHRALGALAPVIAAGLMTSAVHAASYPPARNADTVSVPPRASLSGATCTATGTWFDTDGNGDGSWSKTAKRRCKVPGVWTDAFGYTWTVQKGPHKTLTGSVNYNNIAPCTDQE